MLLEPIFNPCYQISDELRQILTSVPKVRTNEGLKKVSRIMFFEKVFCFCSDLESAQHVSHLMLYFLSFTDPETLS